LLRPASRPDLDATRILTMSGTIAINLIAMGLLMMPLAMPPPATWEEPKSTISARLIQPEVVQFVPIAPPIAPVVTPQPIKHDSVALPTSQATSTVVPSETGSEFVDTSTASDDAGPAAESIGTPVGAPAAVQLEYLTAPPPKYPRMALQRQIEGTVMLQVLVGTDGRPLQVTISHTSGNRELDEAARNQILNRWSFRPAMKNGQAVQAIGLVPVAFNLRN
jgi:protein TonB